MLEGRSRLVTQDAMHDLDAALDEVRVRLRKHRPLIEPQGHGVLPRGAAHDTSHARPQRATKAHGTGIT